MIHRILIVDDEPAIRQLFARALADAPYEVSTAASAEEALAGMAGLESDLVITDVQLPGISGLELLEHLRATHPQVDVVVITGQDNMEMAVRAMRAGAYDYLAKPLSAEQIGAVVGRCLRDRAMRRRMQGAEETATAPGRRTLVGHSPGMVEIYKMIGLLAGTRAPVFIRGETGTGKELVARAIHSNSPASREPFVAVNCTALPETLLESELFGHVRGAFSGAVASRKGRFELAGSGTIFLDEIGDTSLAFQAKVLRVLQEREFYPVGGERPRRTEARVIAATHRPLEELVAAGRFREDLYYRLKVVQITVPPLRERRGDIPALAQHFLARLRREIQKDVRVIPPDVMTILATHDWPGNVRELENALIRAAVLARGPAISAEHLALDTGGAPPSSTRGEAGPENETLRAVESAHVRRILEKTGGNKRRAARILGISRPRLDRLIAIHGLLTPGNET